MSELFITSADSSWDGHLTNRRPSFHSRTWYSKRQSSWWPSSQFVQIDWWTVDTHQWRV